MLSCSRVSTVLGTVGTLSTVPAAMHQAAAAEQGAQARQRLLEVHRATVANLRDAAGEAASGDRVRAPWQTPARVSKRSPTQPMRRFRTRSAMSCAPPPRA